MGHTENGYNYIFDSQKNLGWGRTFNMTGKAPAINKRIFEKLEYAQAYVDNPLDTAIEGLILTVIGDSEALNGAYLVKSVAMPVYNEDGSIKYDDEENAEIAGGKLGVLVKLSDSNIDASLFTVVSELPTASANVLNKIYLKKDTTIGDSENKYTEYICVETVSGETKTYAWEKLGEYKATIELDNVVKTDENNQIGSLNVSFTDNKLHVENGGGTSLLELGPDHGFIAVDDSELNIVESGATIIGRDEVVISSGNNYIKINPSGTTLSRDNADIIMEDDKINIQGRDNVTIGYNSEGHYMSISSGETIIARNNNTISLTDGDLEIDVNGTIFGFDSSGASFPKDGLTVGGTTVSLEGHNHDDLYYTEAEVNNLLKDKLSTTTDGEISVNEIVHLGGVFDEVTKDSLRLIHGEDTERRIELTSTGINFEVNYEYTDENEDHQSVATTVTINDTLRVGGTPVSLEGHTHDGLEKIAQLEATIATMQQTIASLQQQIEGLTTGQGIVTPENIGQFAVTSITGENSDISATERDENGNVVISLNSITNIAYGDATEIGEENTAQF